MTIGAFEFRSALLKAGYATSEDGFYNPKDIQILDEYKSFCRRAGEDIVFQNVWAEFLGGKKVFLYKRKDNYYLFEAAKHNLLGPAVIFPDGTEEYYIFGVKYSKEEYNIVIKKINTIINFG